MRLRASQRGALLAVLVSGCSLLQLDDFDRPRCTTDAECHGATRETGEDPLRCRVFRCNQDNGVCERAATEGPERCDGEDNDCDGYIDEGARREEPPMFKSDADLDDTPLAHALTSRTAYAAVLGSSTATGYQVVDGLPRPPAQLTYTWDESGAGAEQNCPTADESSDICTFAELALAAESERVLGVAINSSGCTRGQVRIAESTRSDPYKFQLGSTLSGSTFDQGSLAVGVDVSLAENSHLCTGASRDPNEPRGATLPAVASVEDSDRGQALALWLASASSTSTRAPVCRARDQSVAVEALGIFSSTADALEATFQRRPQELGRTNMLSAPAVLGVTETRATDAQQSDVKANARFLVAFAVTAQADLTGPAGADRLQFLSVKFAPGAKAPLQFESVGSLPDEGAHHVTLRSGTNNRIGAVWRSGCAGEVTLRFAELTWTLDRNLDLAGPIPLATGNIVRGPFLLHSPVGFFTGRRKGGWFVSWVERTQSGDTQLKLATVAEHASTVVETVTLASGAVDLAFPHWLSASIPGYSAILHNDFTDREPEPRSSQCIDEG